MAEDAARTEEAVVQHLRGLYADHDSARLSLCTLEVEALFRGLRSGVSKGSRPTLPSCPELEDALGPTVVAELQRVLGTLQKSLSEAKITPEHTTSPSESDPLQHPSRGLARSDAWAEHEESSHDTLHSPGGSCKQPGTATPPDAHLLRYAGLQSRAELLRHKGAASSCVCKVCQWLTWSHCRHSVHQLLQCMLGRSRHRFWQLAHARHQTGCCACRDVVEQQAGQLQQLSSQVCLFQAKGVRCERTEGGSTLCPVCLGCLCITSYAS